MPVGTTARKAATKAVVRKVAAGAGSVALAAAETAARSPTLRRLLAAQVALVLFMAVALPVLLLGISTSTRPGAEELADGEAVTGPGDVPPVAALAYVRASSRAKELVPGCSITPGMLAGIYDVESQHGGGRLNRDGVAVPPLTGDGTRGPGNFSASTWKMEALDGNGDRVADPQNIHDAALTTSTILCRSAAGGDLTSRPVLEPALSALGRTQPSYVDDVIISVGRYEGMFRAS